MKAFTTHQMCIDYAAIQHPEEERHPIAVYYQLRWIVTAQLIVNIHAAHEVVVLHCERWLNDRSVPPSRSHEVAVPTITIVS